MTADEWFRATMMYRRWKKRRWVKYAKQSRAHTEAGIADLAAG
jgi:Na+-driven multidrug efflux pump